MRYSLRQIEVFLAIAHHENVSRAAEQLALSQSAASGALKDLESQFDTLLFDRLGKRLKLNQQGRAIQAKAEALIAQAKALQNALSQNSELGDLNIGATVTIGNYLLVDLMARYQQQAQNARIQLDIANTESIVRELLNFDIDVGMLEGETQHPELEIHPWRTDNLLCFCAPEHPLAKQSTVSIDELINDHWILREPGSGTRQAFDRAMHGYLSQLHIAFEFDHTEVIKQAVSRRLGIGCLSDIALEEDINHGRLVALNCPQLDFSRQLYIAIHRQKFRTASLEHWLNLCGWQEHSFEVIYAPPIS